MAESTMPGLPAVRNQFMPEPDLLRELVQPTVNALLTADADAVCGAVYGGARRSAPTSETATASGVGIPAPAPSTSRSPAARRQLLPRLALGATPEGHPAARGGVDLQEPGVSAGGRARRVGGVVPHPS